METIERILGIIKKPLLMRPLNACVFNNANRITDLEQRLENMEHWAQKHHDDFLKVITELDWRYYDLGQGPKPEKPRPTPRGHR